MLQRHQYYQPHQHQQLLDKLNLNQLLIQSLQAYRQHLHHLMHHRHHQPLPSNLLLQMTKG
jgi:hypothetical protein